jgi:hypothetical protein
MEIITSTRQKEMTLQDIAKICWENRVSINFGGMNSWPTNLFLENWFKSNNHSKLWVKGKDRPAWYWFSSDIPLIDLKNLSRPSQLPESACDFGDVSLSNDTLFNREICQKKSHINIVYNGHDADVLGRIRAHFLGSKGNGALGLQYYAISKYDWSVSLFHRKMLDNISHLSDDEKKRISAFCNSHTGRVAIEGVWRVVYGWPILCKA